MYRIVLFAFAFFLVLFAGPTTTPAQTEADPAEVPCGQPIHVREPLIEEATRTEFNTRRVEIAGNTYTRYRDFRKRMVSGLIEGDIFTRSALEASVRHISKMRSIYPITMDNIELRLDRDDRSIDIVICVKQRPKRKRYE